MADLSKKQSSSHLSSSELIIRWGELCILSLIIILFFVFLKISAGFMLGPMLAGVIMEIRNKRVVIHKSWFAIAQTILGCVIISSINFQDLSSIMDHWAITSFTALSVVLVSLSIGGILAFLGIMPGTTALWGSSPGAASTMVVICESFGADPRLAAFMLYFRVILVAITTSFVGSIVSGINTTHHIVSPIIHHHIPLPMIIEMIQQGTPAHVIFYTIIQQLLYSTPTILLIILSGVLGLRFKLSAAPFILIICIGILAKSLGLFPITAPVWMRAPAYLIIGWSIGLRFTSSVIKKAIHTFPAVFLASSAMVASCALLAWPVSKLAHISLLSAYLATSPGGLDTIIIISASVPNVALPFIITMQTARMIAVLVIGPAVARPLGTFIEKYKKRNSHITKI